MSLGYADRLSNKDVGGQLGSNELFDSKEELASKVEQLTDMVRSLTSHCSALNGKLQTHHESFTLNCVQIRDARSVVVFTGAGNPKGDDEFNSSI